MIPGGGPKQISHPAITTIGLGTPLYSNLCIKSIIEIVKSTKGFLTHDLILQHLFVERLFNKTSGLLVTGT